MRYLIILSFIAFLTSCESFQDLPPANYSFGGGVYIVNEGNFNRGNGSVSFYSYDSLKIFNDLFSTANNRPLGDVPNSMAVNSDKGYILVNNSGKIEIVNIKTLKSAGTISGLISPRNMAVINNSKGYVTSLYSDSLTIIDLSNNSISGYIDMGGTTEAIAIAGNLAYVSNWVGGNTVRVISALNNKVIDTISVGSEPESMVIDRNMKLWVLCPGSWRRDTYAELDVIDIHTRKVEKKYQFPSLQNSPSCLKIDALGQTLYYINKGVWKMDISSEALPVQPLIAETNNSYFYKIAINPVNSDILVTDAGDFMQPGYVSVYKNDGVLFSRNRAGIIPGSMAFHLTINPN
jgi:YVTN family beta-propeller protein